MSSSISYEDCPRCHGKETVYSELNCRSMEEWSFCTECGRTYNRELKRDDDGEVFSSLLEYDIEKCMLGVEKEGKLIWTKHLLEVPGGYKQIIFDWPGFEFNINEKFENKLKEIFGEAVPTGHRNLFFETDECPEQMIFFMTWIDENLSDNEKIVIREAQYVTESSEGYGIINVTEKGGLGSGNSVPENTSREKVLEMVEDIKRCNPDRIEKIYATWFDEEKKELEVLIDE